MTLARLDVREERDAIAVWRRHWMALARRIRSPFLATAVGLVGLVLPSGEARLAGAALFLAALAWGAYEAEDWRNDRYILTPTHIVNEQRKPLLGGGSRYELPLVSIQSISVDQKGWKRLLLGYGTVIISSAAHVRGAVFWVDVPHPKKVAKAVDMARREALETERQELRRDVVDAVVEAQHAAMERRRSALLPNERFREV